MLAYSDIVDELTHLSRAQQRDLKARLQGLTASDKVDSARSDRKIVTEDANNDWLLAGLAWEGYRRGLCAHLAPRHLTFMDSYKTYRSKAADMRALLVNGFDEPPAPSVCQTVGRVAGRCLFEHVSRYVKGLSMSIVLSSIERLPEAIDADFPGYIQQKLLQVIVRGATPLLS